MILLTLAGCELFLGMFEKGLLKSVLTFLLALYFNIPSLNVLFVATALFLSKRRKVDFRFGSDYLLWTVVIGAPYLVPIVFSDIWPVYVLIAWIMPLLFIVPVTLNILRFLKTFRLAGPEESGGT